MNLIYILLIIIVILLIFFTLFFRNKQEKLLCHICNKKFTGDEKNVFNKHNFCKIHLKYVKNNTFIQVVSTISDPNNPNNSLLLYNIRESLWDQESIPSVSVEKYINKNDHLYTTVTLLIERKHCNTVNDYLNKYLK